MPILPLVDLLILFASWILAFGALLKLYNVVWSQSAAPLGFAPLDLLLISVSMLVFAIALIGRQWLKANESSMLAGQRASTTLDAYREARGAVAGASAEGATAPRAPAHGDPPEGGARAAGWETRSVGR